MPARSYHRRSRPTTWRTLRTPDGLRPGPRELEREARSYAERWYQAIREPVIDEVPLTPTERGSPSSRSMVLVGVGAFTSRRGPALGGGGGVARYMRTPGPRRFTEIEVGAIVVAVAVAGLPSAIGIVVDETGAGEGAGQEADHPNAVHLSSLKTSKTSRWTTTWHCNFYYRRASK